MPLIKLKNAYAEALPSDGPRILVDRLWPRGISKERLNLDAWLKDVAPSQELRKWFGHDPEKWAEFRRRYFAELAEREAAVNELIRRIGDGPATLVFAASDQQHNNAVALRDYLASKGMT
jgi:uncharacterized protein YeaO (DUF488 family)